MNTSGSEALEIARNNQNRTLQKFYKEKPTYPKIPHDPKFKLPGDGKFFTIGSCFARNIENALRESNVSILSEVPALPGEYYEIGGNSRTGYQNVYTPGSIFEAINLVKGRSDHAIVGNEEKYLDLLTSGLAPLERETAYSIRNSLVTAYKRLPEADALIITLGYNESWFYAPDSCYINRAPSNIMLRRKIDQFEFSTLNYAASFELLKKSMQLVHEISPACKVILTVSPVPLGDTFTTQSVVVANQLSKSTLRTVASAIASSFSFVDYFPSYEMILESERSETFMEDGIHIKAEPVKNVISQFKSNYIV